MAVRSLAQSSIRQSPSVNSMLAGYQGNQFHHLETIRLSSNATSIEFINLARYADYQHLQIRAAICDAVSFQDASSYRLRFNGDSGANYSWHQLKGNGSAVSSSAGANQSGIFGENGGQTRFSATVIDILDPFDTAKHTTTRTLDGYANSSRGIVLGSGSWRNTTSITSLSFTTEGFGFISGSRFSLYGLKARA
jgi:hypothetical protein